MNVFTEAEETRSLDYGSEKNKMMLLVGERTCGVNSPWMERYCVLGIRSLFAVTLGETKSVPIQTPTYISSFKAPVLIVMIPT